MAETLPLDHTVPIPRPRTRLLGRQAELASARTALLDEDVPLLTLTGPGGVGKTRLALAVAGDVAGAFVDTVVWVDLAPLTNPGLVPAALAAALGLTPAPDQSVTDLLVRHLRSRQLLLLLDNCEHVVAATAELAAALLTACPALQILATSRSPVRIRGEHEYPLDPLPLPPADAVSLESLAQNDAVRLFVERARAVRPTFTLTETNAPAVAALCRHLDGLPLAIELAAARSSILSPAALLAQMTDRLRLLRDGPRDLHPHQQTVEATIAWSHALLDPAAQTLLRRLAVFHGGCDLEAIAAVTGGDTPQLLESLPALHDQGLLRTVDGADGRDRYTMLETVREYARERLEASGEAEAIRDAHAAHFLALVESAEPHLRGPEQLPWQRRFEADYPNLRAAMGWLRERGDAEAAWRLAGALFPFWQLRHSWVEGRQRLEEVLALPATTRTAAWAKAQTALGYMTFECYDEPRARVLLEEALAVWQELGDQWGSAIALAELMAIDLVAGNLDRARLLGEQALATFRAFDDDYWAPYTLWTLGVVSLRSGDNQQARAELEETIQPGSAFGTFFSRFSKRALGWVALAEGDERRAAALWEERLAACRERDEEQAIATNLDDLGWLALRQRDWDRATDCFAEELALGEKLNDDWYVPRALAGLAVVSAEAGQPARAAWLFGAAEAAAIEKHLDNDLFNRIREPYERAMAATRQVLADEAFAVAWQAGRELPLQQAVLSALAAAVDPTAMPEEGSVMAGQGVYDRLTQRETEVLRLLVRRQTDKEIAAALFISPRTAHHHVARIFSKLGVDNRRAAAATALRLGLV